MVTLRSRKGNAAGTSPKKPEAAPENSEAEAPPSVEKSAEDKPTKPSPKGSSTSSGKVKKTAQQSWDDKLAELKRFKVEHGHTNVPKTEEYKQLGRFVNNQRQFYRKKGKGEKNSLTEERIAALEELGFAWSMKPVSENRAAKLQAQWEQRMSELKEYKKIHGHCNVASKTHKELGKFVLNQRHYYKARIAGQKNSLTPQRIQELESIGFVWNLKGVKSDEGKYLNNEEKWNRNFEELRRFKEKYGHVNVTKSKEFAELGQFVGSQRYLYRRRLKGERTSLTEDRIRMLSGLGFEFKPRSANTAKCDVTLKAKGGNQIAEKDQEVALPDGSKIDIATKETSQKRMVPLEDGSYLLEITTTTYTTKVEQTVLPEEMEEDLGPDADNPPPAYPGESGVVESQKKVAYPDGSTVEHKKREICKKCLIVQNDGTQLLETKTTTRITKIERTRLPEESEAIVEPDPEPLGDY